MKKDLQEKLFRKYPELFVQKNLSMKETCMCWGIDCGDGWYSLLDNICSWLDWNMKNNPHVYPRVEFIQVKKKFGILRLYYSTRNMTEKEYNDFKRKRIFLPDTYEKYCGKLSIWEKLKKVYYILRGWNFYKNLYGSEIIEGAISFAEYLSGTVCEECGKPAETKDINGWIYTLCSICKKKLINAKKGIKRRRKS